MNRIFRLVPILVLLTGINAMAGEKSAKKQAADEPTLGAPQVLEVGDSLLGARLGQGTDFGGAAALGVSYEYMFHQNFGVNPQLHYSSYSSKISVGPIDGEWDYTAWTLSVQGTFHVDLFKSRNWDPYLSAGIGRSFISSHWKANGFDAPAQADSSSTYLLAYANFRYFINSSWGIQASVGTGLGTFSIGIDHLF
jgi:outer membrane protein W